MQNPCDIKKLNILNQKPSINSKASDFWTDPYISGHVLHAHLSQTTDAGSRKATQISAEADWILKMTKQDPKPERPVKDKMLVLDLGCGPGLYAREFLMRGLNVYGMDFSPASIKYAKNTLKEFSGPSANFKKCNFLRSGFPCNIDTAVMIYGIFCNLHDKDRDKLLKKLTKSLPPGSRFIFDVFTRKHAEKEALKEGWYFAEKDGFWMEGPHLVLERHWLYEKHKTVFNAYYIIDSNGGLHSRLVRHRWYDKEELAGIMEKFGFKIIHYSSDLTGTPYKAEGPWIAVVAEAGANI